MKAASCPPPSISSWTVSRKRATATATMPPKMYCVTPPVVNRVVAALRDGDVIARVGDARFAICLSPVRNLDLEACLQLATRLQTALEEPVPLQSVSIYPTCSIGFCLSARLSQPTGAALSEAADMALSEARRAGLSSIRAYQPGFRRRAISQRKNDLEASKALDRDEIKAWFQPQINTDTGEVSGFEALARWHHPKRGTLPPVEFLGSMQQGGQLERLANRMLTESLGALKAWHKAGWDIAHSWRQLRRGRAAKPRSPGQGALGTGPIFELEPRNLCVEVLETVIAGTPDDVVVRNVNGLAELGCGIDLDDFGTGHASISSIRRLRASRLKIDRSFVTRVDQDIEQQRMVAAIVTMAERLGWKPWPKVSKRPASTPCWHNWAAIMFRALDWAAPCRLKRPLIG